jgi:hypothetical protein
MNYDSNLYRCFLLAPIVPSLWMLLVLLRRKLFSEVPWFCLYLSYLTLGSVLLFLIYQSGGHDPSLAQKWTYFYSAWIFEGGIEVISFMAILDCIRSLLKNLSNLRRGAVLVLLFVTIGLALFCVFCTSLGLEETEPMMRLILSLVRSVRILQVGLIVTLFALSSYFGLSWKNHFFGIALGFGLYASANLACIAYVAEFGAEMAWKTMIIDQVAFFCTLMIWLGYIRSAEPWVSFSIHENHELERWDAALARVLGRPITQS